MSFRSPFRPRGSAGFMELVSKIFETLDVSQLALLQLGLVVVLAFLLSTLLIKPILRTFEELKVRIAAERESAAALLRAQVSYLSTEIARKVLGRPVA